MSIDTIKGGIGNGNEHSEHPRLGYVLDIPEHMACAMNGSKAEAPTVSVQAPSVLLCCLAQVDVLKFHDYAIVLSTRQETIPSIIS